MKFKTSRIKHYIIISGNISALIVNQFVAHKLIDSQAEVKTFEVVSLVYCRRDVLVLVSCLVLNIILLLIFKGAWWERRGPSVGVMVEAAAQTLIAFIYFVHSLVLFVVVASHGGHFFLVDLNQELELPRLVLLFIVIVVELLTIVQSNILIQ